MEQRTFKEIRESKGIKKSHICEVLGISRQSLYSKEEGYTKFSALEAQKLCCEYNISISEVKIGK